MQHRNEAACQHMLQALIQHVTVPVACCTAEQHATRMTGFQLANTAQNLVLAHHKCGLYGSLVSGSVLL